MSDLRGNLIRLAHANPELRKDLIPLLKQANPIRHWKLKKGVAHIRYRIESGGKRLLVLISYRGNKDRVLISDLAQELTYVENEAKGTAKTLSSLMSQGSLGLQTFSMDSVEAEFDSKYPILVRHSSYYEIFDGKEETVRGMMENLMGASELKR
jgi:mRNA-degrading endonuclease RelE of RelBE toxin-antitoxin system